MEKQLAEFKQKHNEKNAFWIVLFTSDFNSSLTFIVGIFTKNRTK